MKHLIRSNCTITKQSAASGSCSAPQQVGIQHAFHTSHPTCVPHLDSTSDFSVQTQQILPCNSLNRSSRSDACERQTVAERQSASAAAARRRHPIMATREEEMKDAEALFRRINLNNEVVQ